MTRLKVGNIQHPDGTVDNISLTDTGRVGLGTSSPAAPLHILGAELRLQNDTKFEIGFRGSSASTSLAFRDAYAGADRVTIDSSGRVGIGTTSPSQLLEINGESTPSVQIKDTTNNVIARIGADDNVAKVGSRSNHPLQFQINDGEVARLDTSGRLLVGTSSALTGNRSQYSRIAAVGNSTGTGHGVLSISSTSAAASLSSGNEVGQITFGSTNGDFAWIQAFADATPGTNDYPGRLVFSTTADGSSSPTERMRIYNNGDIALFNCSKLYPASDNATSLGLSGNRFSVVYAATGSINTSDATLKQDIEELDAAELSVATAIKGLIKKFRFTDAVSNKGDDARIHVGVIAQEVEQAFVAAGLDPRRYGMFCEDTLEDGTKRLGIRYDELLAFVIAAI